MATKLSGPTTGNNVAGIARAGGRLHTGRMPGSRLPPDLDAFERRRTGPCVVVVRADVREAIEALGLDRSPAPPAGAASPDGGRGGAWIASLPAGGEIVIRPGRRGGWFGRWIRSRYFIGDRFVDELILTERLRRRGAPVPEPLAAVRRARPPGYETWLVTRRIPGAVPAAEAWAAAPEGRLPDLLDAAGRAVGRLHAAGGEHADLNAWNVLVGDDRAWIVDLDRGGLRPAPLARARATANLARLRRSLVKLELTGALAAWPAFECGYASVLEA